VETPRGSCRLRIGRFVSVFGRIFLVLLGCFWVPVGLFLLVRRGIYGQVSPQEPLMGRRPPVRVQSVGVSSPSSGAGRIAEKIERWIGPFSAGYFTVSAFCVFQYVGFAAWVNLHHNSMGAYCRYDQIGRTGNFYAYGQICNINWVEWLQYWFVLTFVFTAILQIPIVTLGAYCCANRLYRHLQDRRGRSTRLASELFRGQRLSQEIRHADDRVIAHPVVVAGERCALCILPVADHGA